MEYLDTKVMKVATCSICFKILKSPLKLPCLNIVCQSHIQDILNSNGRRINCPICNFQFTDLSNIKNIKIVNNIIYKL